jgi:tRNA (adenine37-N6)-methyltransferase
MVLLPGVILVFGGQPAFGQEKSLTGAVVPKIGIEPLGHVERRDGKIFVEVEPAYAAALDGIEGFSHIWVIYWFHGNDTPEKRRTLKVHPRRDPANPLTGVFATRSPARPNLVGLNACRLVRREGNRLEVEGLDAWDASPVLDIKPYLPQLDSFPETTIPKWAQGMPPE